MKKIVFVFHNSEINSGATHSLVDSIEYLLNTGKYEIETVFPDSNGTCVQYFHDHNIPVHIYRYGNLMQDLSQTFIKRIIKFPILCLRYLLVKREAHKAAKDFEESKVDLVYTNTSCVIFGGFLGQYLSAKNIWHIREFRKEDHRICFFLGDKYLQRFINTYADWILFVSKSVLNAHKYIDKAKTSVTYNCYPKTFISPKLIFNKTKKLNILIAGDIKPSKGQLDVVKAVALANQIDPEFDFKLHLAGKLSNITYVKEIKKFVVKNKLEGKIILYGSVKEMSLLRKNMYIGIVASTNEALGRTTAEGMLSMIVMIGRNSGGTTEQIQDGITGLLYDGSISELAHKILYLNNNRDVMERIAREAFSWAVNFHTKGRAAKIAELAIDRVLSDKR